MPAALSRDGKVLVTRIEFMAEAAETQIWDLVAGRAVAKLNGVGSWGTIALSPDGTILATRSHGVRGMVQLWDVASGRSIRTLGPLSQDWLNPAFSPDGRRLLVGGFTEIDPRPGLPGELILWDVQTGEKVVSFVGHTGGVLAVAFAPPDGRLIASAGMDKTVRLWDVNTGREIQTLSGYDHLVNGLEFSPDGRLLAATSMKGIVTLWDVATRREVSSLRGHLAPAVNLAFQRDSRLVSNGADRIIKRWDLATDTDALTLHFFGSEASEARFSPDDQKLAVMGVATPIKMYGAGTGQELLTTSSVYSNHGLAFSPDGKALAAIGQRGIYLLDPSTGRNVLTFGSVPRPSGVAFGPDGRSIASVSPGAKPGAVGVVKLWDATSGKELLEFPGHRREKDKIGAIAYSPDGRFLVTACFDNAVHIYDLTTRERIHRLEGHAAPVIGVVISPDGRLIASVSDDATIKLWDTTTGAEIRTLRGHAREVVSAAFSPDGTRLVSGSNDETLKLWDVASGQEILTLRGHAGVVRGVSFSHDGQKIASCSADGTIKIWEATPLTPELRQSRLAAVLVNRKAAEFLIKEEVIEQLRSDPTISEAVRREALALVERYREDSSRLFSQAMQVIARPGTTENQYAHALLRAQRATQLEPENNSYFNMVGMGHYRLGQYDKAIAILEQADSQYVAKGIRGGGAPWTLAFLAMTYHKLDKHDEARASLVRLRKCMSHQSWSSVPLYQAMLREAEALIEGTSPEQK
jgi:WD40 repeat protein